MSEVKFENLSSEVMNAFVSETPMLNHDRVIVCLEFKRTGAFMAFWVTRITNVAMVEDEKFSVTRDPNRAHQFPVTETPMLFDKYVEMLDDLWDDFNLVDFKIVRMRMQ